MDVGDIAKFFGDEADFSLGLWADVIKVMKSPGDCGDGFSDPVGDVFKGCDHIYVGEILDPKRLSTDIMITQNVLVIKVVGVIRKNVTFPVSEGVI